MLARVLVAAAIAWPVLGGLAVRARTADAEPARPVSTWVRLVYLGAAQVCHQRPERSFSSAGVSWPVCARCAGLYAAAPLAALWAVLGGTRPRRLASRAVAVLAVAAIPTVLTLMWEWGGMGTPSNLWRFATALPLGAAVAVVLVCTAAGAGSDRLSPHASAA